MSEITFPEQVAFLKKHDITIPPYLLETAGRVLYGGCLLKCEGCGVQPHWVERKGEHNEEYSLKCKCKQTGYDADQNGTAFNWLSIGWKLKREFYERIERQERERERESYIY